MSFLYRTAASATRCSRPTTRLFSTSVHRPKSATDTVKEPLKKVDRAVSDAAVSGIEKGQQAAAKAKEAVGVGAKKAEGKTEEVAGEAKQKTAELSEKAKK
ncbi:MAG: hypothetical protein Q9227_005128 [Pyrenula ochraceoflavens]